MSSKNEVKTIMRRRDFLGTAGVIAAGSFTGGTFNILKAGESPNSKVNVAMIGGGGVAGQAFGGCKGENIVAVCDVDSKSNKRDGAKSFTDFRVMFDKMGKEIDAVCINTPDHTHFAATMEAMQRGIHVCTQKPLTHNIWQARTLLKAAKKYPKVLTNMGNQGHTYNGIRTMKEWYEAGILGQVNEVHSGIGFNFKGGYFGKPENIPPAKTDVPENLNWDLWIGPGMETDYNPIYHPRKWRGFYNYGGAQLGDWFCHINDGPVYILDLYEPTEVECLERETNLGNLVTDSCLIRWKFPKRSDKAPCNLYWSDGPSPKLNFPDNWSHGKKPGSGSVWLAEKNHAYLDERSNNPRLTERQKQGELKKENKLPAEKYPRVKHGSPHRELMEAIKGGPKCGSRFEYSARLTETSLIGVLAQRFGGKIVWDAKNMKITNRPELNAYIKEPVRKGWEDYGVDLW